MLWFVCLSVAGAGAVGFVCHAHVPWIARKHNTKRTGVANIGLPKLKAAFDARGFEADGWTVGVRTSGAELRRVRSAAAVWRELVDEEDEADDEALRYQASLDSEADY